MPNKTYSANINVRCPNCERPYFAKGYIEEENIIFGDAYAGVSIHGKARTKAIMAMKIGGMKYKDIGDIFDISAGRVRQLVKKALENDKKKVKAPEASQPLTL